jgi:hypothetical protein
VSLWHIWQVRCIAGMSEVVVESGLNAPLVVVDLWPKQLLLHVDLGRLSVELVAWFLLFLIS